MELKKEKNKNPDSSPACTITCDVGLNLNSSYRRNDQTH